MHSHVIAKTSKARKIESVDVEFVKQNDFYDHVNHTVIKPVLGVEITRQAAKDLIYGIANQIMILTLSGARIRLGKLGTFFPRVIKSGPCYDFKSQKSYNMPERKKLGFKPSNSARRAFELVK